MGSVHLLLLVHGMWGSPVHLSELERVAREIHSEGVDGIRLHILVAQSIREESTYDGIDWNGERVAKEVVAAVKDLESDGTCVTRFSVTGYSLGGLVARYCIGVLNQQGFFDTIKPVNFNTIATPHCGLPRYKTLLSSIASTLGPKLLSRTGEQFYCADKWSPKGRPLLVVMADPDREFHKALAKFQYIRIYANAINDRTVPYVTSAIETSDPFVDFDAIGMEVKYKENYNNIVKEYSVPSTPPPRREKPVPLSAAWFKRFKFPLPPPLQYRFPVNILVYALVPILIPGLIGMVLVRFALASRSSRARIKELESEAHGSERPTLYQLVTEMEREVEDAVIDLIESTDDVPHQAPPPKAHPIISPHHRRIAAWLNTLDIKKEIAFFTGTRFAHGIIICRDMNRLEHHRGEGVVRHWADSFVL